MKEDIDRVKRATLLLSIFSLALVSSYAFMEAVESGDNSMVEQRNDTAREVLMTVENKSEKDLYRIRFTTRNGPVDPGYLVIYSSEGKPVYDYPVLRTGSKGGEMLELGHGKYFFQYGSQEKPGDGLLFNGELELPEDSGETQKINLKRLSINFRNFPEPMPRFKVEGRPVSGSIPYQPIDFNEVPQESKSTSFWLGEGSYNLNLDQLSWGEERDYTVALAYLDVTNDQNRIEVDYRELERSDYEMKGTELAWFKIAYRPENYSGVPVGDFQSQYYGGSKEVYTNFDSNTEVITAYVPPVNCADILGAENNLTDSELLGKCIDLNIEYSYSDYYLDGDSAELGPPSEIGGLEDLSTTRGSNTRLNYRIYDDSGHRFRRITVHQIWEKDVLPIVEVWNGSSNYSFSLGEEKEFRACLPEGNYRYRLEFPSLTWNDRLVSNQHGLAVQAGSECLSEEAGTSEFSTWREVYSEIDMPVRGHQTVLERGKDENQTEIEILGTIKDCGDAEEMQSKEGFYKVEYNSSQVKNLGLNKRYGGCMRKFSGPNTDFIVQDRSRLTDFSTSKWYSSYFFYSVLKNDNNTVGWRAESFMEFFYQFPDFYLTEGVEERHGIKPEEVGELLETVEGIVRTESIYSLNREEDILQPL